MPKNANRPENPSRFNYPLNKLQELAEDALEYAAKLGASDCKVDVGESFGQSIEVRRGEIDTIEHNREKAVSISVYLGQRQGHASSSDFSEKALHETVAAAIDIARFTSADPCAGLPDADRLADQEQAFLDLGLYHPWLLSVEEAVSIAKRCEQAAFDESPHITNSEGASVSFHESQFIMANSRGFVGGYPTSRHYMDCSPIAGSGEQMQRDGWFSVASDPSQLKTPEALGSYAAKRAISRLNARKIPTCKAPVIFEAPLACSLLGSFVSATSGGNLYRKTSFLLDGLGKGVFSNQVHISERPHLRGALASSPFDSDGIATSDRDVVVDGVLEGFFLGTYSGRKLGMASTANAGGCHNLILRSGSDELDGLIKKMGRGLVVTELLGDGINILNGDYSRGAAGYWVENGEIAYPVEEITIAGKLQDMFLNIVAIGNDRVVRGSKHSGSILIEEMKIAGS